MFCHTVADILNLASCTFADIYGMFGELDYAKLLLRCIACYISGSGLDDVLIEAEDFSSGPRYMARLRATRADWGLDTRILF